MDEKQILENNKLIAEFMEPHYKREYGIVNFTERPSISIQSSSFHVDELEYHKSWDWLMPVVEKIESTQLPSPSMIPVQIGIQGKSCRIFKGEWHDSIEGFISVVSYEGNKEQYTKIEAAYFAVIKFIQWFIDNEHCKNEIDLCKHDGPLDMNDLDGLICVICGKKV